MLPQGLDPRQFGRYVAMAQVGLEMVAPIALGWWLDSLLGSQPWLLVVGVILGLVFGVWHLVVLSNRGDNGQPKDKAP
ncbi:MAG: AtpZ/AtpI family protein [Gemmataceae bacterium]|nr:AtpZ/AtpI family protein [Gemmataceae bacterium]